METAHLTVIDGPSIRINFAGSPKIKVSFVGGGAVTLKSQAGPVIRLTTQAPALLRFNIGKNLTLFDTSFANLTGSPEDNLALIAYLNQFDGVSVWSELAGKPFELLSDDFLVGIDGKLKLKNSNAPVSAWGDLTEKPFSTLSNLFSVSPEGVLTLANSCHDINWLPSWGEISAKPIWTEKFGWDGASVTVSTDMHITGKLVVDGTIQLFGAGAGGTGGGGSTTLWGLTDVADDVANAVYGDLIMYNGTHFARINQSVLALVHTHPYRLDTWVPTWEEVASKPEWLSRMSWDGLSTVVSSDLHVTGKLVVDGTIQFFGSGATGGGGGGASALWQLTDVADEMEFSINGDIPLYNGTHFTRYNISNLSLYGHLHSIAQVTGLQGTLDEKQPLLGYTPYYASNFVAGVNYSAPHSHPYLSDVDARIANWTTAFNWGNHAGLYRPIGYVPSWGEISSKPTWTDKMGWDGAAVTVAGDLHVIGKIISDGSMQFYGISSGGTGGGGSTTLWGLSDVADDVANAVYGDLIMYNGTHFARINQSVLAPAIHTHSIGQVNGLQGALDGKQASGSYVLTSDSRLSDSRVASDVYSWAKASVKPAYVWLEIGGTIPTWNQNTTGTANNAEYLFDNYRGGYRRSSDLQVSYAYDAERAVTATNWSGAATKQNVITGLNSGYLPKWAGSGFVNSMILDDGASLDLGFSTGQKLFLYSAGNTKIGFGIDLSGTSRELSLFCSSSNGTDGNISFGRRLENSGVYTENMRLTGNGILQSYNTIRTDINKVGESLIATGAGSNFQIRHDGTATVQLINSAGAFNFSGSIGLGTTTPESPLEVYRAYAGDAIIISAPVGTGNKNTIAWNHSKTTGVISARIGTVDDGNYGGNIVFENRTGVGTITSERMRIQTDGNVAIGTTSANGYRLNVAGAGYFSSSIVAGGEITAYSDQRLKSNIQPLKLRGNLHPVTYIKDGKKSIGFIAQEVRDLYPELVKGDEPKEMLSLNYGQLTAVLYAEILELKRQIKEIQSQISNQ